MSAPDLDAIAFGAGPGSFTGLRIACGIAQGLALARDLPVLGVSSFEAAAEEAASGSRRARARLHRCADARSVLFGARKDRRPMAGSPGAAMHRAGKRSAAARRRLARLRQPVSRLFLIS